MIFGASLGFCFRKRPLWGSMSNMETQREETPPVPEVGLIENHVLRWLVFLLGCLCVAAGVIGIFVPGLPTTVFMIIALWAFSKSSERFHDWLWSHRHLGPPVRAWYRYRVIPPMAKALAVGVMAASFIYLVIFVAEDWVLPTVMIAILVPVALYILTRRNRPPKDNA